MVKDISTEVIENEEIEIAMKRYEEEEKEKERKRKEQTEKAVAQMAVQWNTAVVNKNV